MRRATRAGTRQETRGDQGVSVRSFTPIVKASAAHKIGRAHRGQTLLEFAIAAPIFLALAFAMIDLARYFWVIHAMNYVTNQAGRTAITATTFPNGNSTNGNYTRQQSIYITAMQTNNGTCGGLLSIGTASPYNPNLSNLHVEYCSYANTLNSSINSTGGESNLTWTDGAGDYQDLVRVRVDYQFSYITPFMKLLKSTANGTTTLEVSCVQRNLGNPALYLNP